MPAVKAECLLIRDNRYIESLCAAHQRNLLEVLEYGLQNGILALHKLVFLAKTLKISIKRVSHNPAVEFFNVNFPENLLGIGKLIEAVGAR